MTTSSTLSFTLSSAGSSAQSAPKIAAATIISGTRLKAGRNSRSPMKQAAMAPAMSCPSAPMFQNFARKATSTARPVKSSGAAFTSVSWMS